MVKNVVMHFTASSMLALVLLGMQLAWGASTVSVQAAGAYADSNGSISSPCPTGQFLDGRNNQCRALVHPEYGFRTDEFNVLVAGTVYTLQVCTESELKNLLSVVGPAGGTINIPACTIEISGPLSLPNNVILQGSGVDKTIIKAGAGSTDQLILVKNKHNVVLRDMSLDAGGLYLQTVLIWYADNVTLERLHVFGSTRTAVELRYVTKLSVRYVRAHHAGTYHGIVIKDCLNETPIPNLARCQAQYNGFSHQYGPLWTTSFQIYSNTVYNNADHGLDIHGTYGEVAGNYSHDNMYGSKFMDGQYLDIHHNRFENNASWGTHVNVSIDIADLIPTDIFYYQNDFIGSRADYPVRIADPASNIRLAYNTYSGSTNNALRITAATTHVFVCADGQDAAMVFDGNQPSILSQTECAQYKNSTAVPSVTPVQTVTPTPSRIATPLPTVTSQQAITPTVCPGKSNGDADCDGVTSLVDYEIWRREFQEAVATFLADFDGSRSVTMSDFELWRRQYTR